MSILTGVVKAFGSRHSRGDRIALIGDSSGSMTADLEDGVTRFEAQAAVMRDLCSKHGNVQLGLFSSTAILINSPSEITWSNGLDGGTRFTPIFELANTLDIDHLYVFSDGEPYDEHSEIFAARGMGNYKISTFFFGYRGWPGEALMERLVRGGKAYVVDSAEGLRAAVSAESGVDLGAQKMAQDSWGGGPDLSGEIKGALQVVGDRVALHGHLVDVAGRVNNVAERVGIVEDRLKIGRAMTAMLQQLDRHTAEALEVIGDQYSAAEQRRLSRSQQLDAVLLSSGSEMGRMSQQHIGGALVNYANDAQQMTDRSAPTKIPLVALDASVISRANALLAGGQARAPELPRPAQPEQQRREPLGVPINQQALPAPQRAMVPSRWGE